MRSSLPKYIGLQNTYCRSTSTHQNTHQCNKMRYYITISKRLRYIEDILSNQRKYKTSKVGKIKLVMWTIFKTKVVNMNIDIIECLHKKQRFDNAFRMHPASR